MMMRVWLWLLTWSVILHFSVCVDNDTEVAVNSTEPAILPSPLWTIFPSSLIAGLGVIVNTISLSYFVRREHSTLGSQLLMQLNVLDLMVSVSGVFQLSFMVVYFAIPDPVHELFNCLYFIFLEATGFTTCLLSITRCISLYVPFYKIRRHVVRISAGLFFAYTVAREVTLTGLVDRGYYLSNGLLQIHIGVVVSEIGIMILVASIFNIISIGKIIAKPKLANASPRTRAATGQHATVTVIIVSACFCVLNTFYLTTEILYFFFGVKFSQSLILYFGIFYAVPLNSLANPLIYLLRKREMREYLRALCDPRRDSRYNPRNRTLSLAGMSTSTSVARSMSSGTTRSPISMFMRRNTMQGSSPTLTMLRGSEQTVFMNHALDNGLAHRHNGIRARAISVGVTHGVNRSLSEGVPPMRRVSSVMRRALSDDVTLNNDVISPSLLTAAQRVERVLNSSTRRTLGTNTEVQIPCTGQSADKLVDTVNSAVNTVDNAVNTEDVEMDITDRNGVLDNACDLK